MRKKQWLAALRGKGAEYLFAAECSERGYVIHFPCTELIPYDFVVNTGRSMKRVQVKSTRTKSPGRPDYHVHTSSKSGKYKVTDFDFYALYLGDEKAWYIIPTDKISATSIRIKAGKGRFEEYREAWNLLE